MIVNWSSVGVPYIRVFHVCAEILVTATFEQWVTNLLQPAVNIEDESGSEESHYSGLEEEPDTDEFDGEDDEDSDEGDEVEDADEDPAESDNKEVLVWPHGPSGLYSHAQHSCTLYEHCSHGEGGVGGGEGEPLLCIEALQYCLGLEDKAAGMVGLSSHPTHKSYSSS